MRSQLTLASLLALALFGLAARPAHAQSTCSTDSDCVKGWACQVTGGGACASAPCAPGEKCEQPSDCVTEEFKSCQPGACRADSECAAGMVCYTHTESDCAPSACAAGQECPTPSCEPRTESACVPRYLLPCTTASDCGSGFKCEPAGDDCACGGTVPRDDSGDGGTPVPSEPNCVCEPSKDFRCNATPVNCEKDADCVEGWTCALVASASNCTAPASDPGAGAQGGAAPPPPDCRPSVDVKQCVPPYYTLIEGVKGGARDASEGATLATGGSTSGNPAVPPTAASAKDDPTASAGCSVGRATPRGSALALLGALGLIGALRRRRAR